MKNWLGKLVLVAAAIVVVMDFSWTGNVCWSEDDLANDYQIDRRLQIFDEWLSNTWKYAYEDPEMRKKLQFFQANFGKVVAVPGPEAEILLKSTKDFKQGTFAIAPLVIIEEDQLLGSYWLAQYNNLERLVWTVYYPEIAPIVVVGINSFVAVSPRWQAVALIYEIEMAINLVYGGRSTNGELSVKDKNRLEDGPLRLHAQLAERLGGAVYQDTVKSLVGRVVSAANDGPDIRSYTPDSFERSVKNLEKVFGPPLSEAEFQLRAQTLWCNVVLELARKLYWSDRYTYNMLHLQSWP